MALLSPRAATTVRRDRLLADARRHGGRRGAAGPRPARTAGRRRASTRASSSAPSSIPTPSGRTRCACGVLLGPALPVLAPRATAPRAAIAAVLGGAGLPAVAAGRARGGRGARRPSTEEPPSPRRAPRSRTGSRPTDRIEVPFTGRPLGGAHTRDRTCRSPVAGTTSRPRRPTRSSTTTGLHAGGLRPVAARVAVRFVALSDAPLDYSAEEEARMLERGTPYLRLAHESPGWRIWEVRDARPPASAGARVTAADPAGSRSRPAGRPWCGSAIRAGGARRARV